MTDYDRLAKLVARRNADYQSALRQSADAEQRAEQSKHDLESAKLARQVFQQAAEEAQSRVHAGIATVVTRCLSAVFGDGAYEFKVHFEKKRGRTEARLAFARDGQEIDPVGEAGGGVVDVAAISLRLAAVLLDRRKCRRLLVLDEPLRMLSRGYAEQARDMLLGLAKSLKVQIIMVTHSPEMTCGKVIEIGD